MFVLIGVTATAMNWISIIERIAVISIFSLRRVAQFVLLGALLLPGLGRAETPVVPDTYFDPFSFDWADGRWHAMAGAGFLAKEKLTSIARFRPRLDFEQPIGAIAIGREIAGIGPHLRVEWEAGASLQSEPLREIADFRAMLGVRLTQFPWHRWLPTSFAVFTGPSWLTGPSAQEYKYGKTQRLTNGMAFELTLGLPEVPDWAFMLRVQHRSPLFELAGTSGPVNWMLFGLRHSF